MPRQNDREPSFVDKLKHWKQRIPLFLCSLMLFIPFVIYYCILDFMVSKLFHEFVKEFPNNVNIRNLLLGITTWGGAPLLVWRTTVAAKQANTAQEALLNDKINEAMKQLNARLEETERIGKGDNTKVIKEWKDDIAARVAAINRLEGLVNENNELAPRIVRSLATYVRINFPAPDLTPTIDIDNIQKPRPDLQTAITTIGRILKIAVKIDQSQWRLDLSNCNFNRVNFQGTELTSQSEITGYDFKGLSWAKGYFRAVNFSDCRFEKANFERSYLVGCIFNGSLMNHARFMDAYMVGAHLRFIIYDENGAFSVLPFAKNLDGANFYSSSLAAFNPKNSFQTINKSSFEMVKNLTSAARQYLNTHPNQYPYYTSGYHSEATHTDILQQLGITHWTCTQSE